MTWIKIERPTDSPQVAAALGAGMRGYPTEYSPERRGEMRVPELVKNDAITLAHSLAPAVMQHVFAAYSAMLDPSMPLSRREHEMIAATVSSLNRCFY